MSKLLLFSILFLQNGFFYLHAQVNEQKAAITYDCVFNVLFERGQRFVRFNAMLFSADSGSGFFLNPTSGADDTESNGTEITIQADTLFRVVKDFFHDDMIFGDITFNGKEKLYRDTLHAMHWALTKERKMIDSLECFKATTTYKGRGYTAWYCPSIPIPNGPWKLGGLPGLIIEVYEDQKDLYFLLSGIRYAEHLPVPKIQEQLYPDYNSFIKYWKNFFEMINGSMAAQDNPGCISCLSQSKAKVYTWEKIPF
jgi:GLPGLI family protein